jgi:hypothetical protein
VARIITIDWIYQLSASLMLSRETAHLAVHYLDSFLAEKEVAIEDVHVFTAAALLLSVKQEEREQQSALLTTACAPERSILLRDRVLESEKLILVSLNFRLKSNTLAFWVDYFSLKWDAYIHSSEGLATITEAKVNIGIELKGADGGCYRLYREMMELADVCLMFG